MNQKLREELYPLLGELLAPPDSRLNERLAQARRLAAEVDARAAEDLESMGHEMRALEEGDRAELHSRTFELNPACILYLSVHLFGEESFKRANLMTGLDQAYQSAGFSRGNELPDHLGAVLRFAPHFSAEEWDELTALCLAGPVAKMHESLQQSTNPYRHLLAAVRGLVNLECAREAAHA